MQEYSQHPLLYSFSELSHATMAECFGQQPLENAYILIFNLSYSKTPTLDVGEYEVMLHITSNDHLRKCVQELVVMQIWIQTDLILNYTKWQQNNLH